MKPGQMLSTSKIPNIKSTGGEAQVVEQLPSKYEKHEALNSNPSITKQTNKKIL
jgi:hypothetical protein